MRTRPLFFLIALFLLALSACQPSAESSPLQIASYPSGDGVQNPQYFPPPDLFPQTGILVYDATLSLTAWHVDNAIQRALEIAEDHGGYLTSSSVITEGKTYATLTFAVPASNYTRALKAFKRLGNVTYEQVSGNLYPSYGGQTGWDYTSHVTLHISPHTQGLIWPDVDVSDTRPLRTLSSAFSVLITLLSYLLDLAIWLTVVVGPFALIGWVIRRFLKRETTTKVPSGE